MTYFQKALPDQRRMIVMKHIGKSKCMSERTGYLLSRVVSIMQTGFDRKLKKFGVTRAQWRVITSLDGGDIRTAADFARIWYLDATAVTRLVDRLEAKGLVKRTPSLADRRVNELELTQMAKELVPEMRKEADANHDEIFGGLSLEELNSFRKTLKKILGRIQ